MSFEKLQTELKAAPRTWLVTGVAGFIGSNLLEALLKYDQRVVGLDNLATGFQKNLEEVSRLVSAAQWSRFRFIEGSIERLENCQEACQGVDYVLHQAALGSVPRSIAEPINSHNSNVNGFLNMLLAARDQKVRRFVYASSSSIYGDSPDLPKVENKIGNPLSPYAATKAVNELYAGVFAQVYGMQSMGLRYFNVFGPRQDPAGAYAAVIPKWLAALIKNQEVRINGDGETSRDFCYIANVVQANLLAAATQRAEAINQAYNVAVGDRTTLNQLYQFLKERLIRLNPSLISHKPRYQDFRPGDVRHSLADITKARTLLAYNPTWRLTDGLDSSLNWYLKNAV